MKQKLKQDINLGQNIRSIRKQKKLTQTEVVIKLQLLGFNITQSSLYKIESGVQHIYVSELIAIAEILDVPLSELFRPHGTIPIDPFHSASSSSVGSR